MKRDRLSKSVVPKLLTFTRDINVYDVENFILESAVKKYDGFSHWLAHLDYVRISLSGYKDIYSAKENFSRVKDIVISGLEKEKFFIQAKALKDIDVETDFNRVIINQYTDDSELYYRANKLLRNGHEGKDIGEYNLAPWILQLNSAIRVCEEKSGKFYRGTEMDTADIEKYKINELFVWSSFSSFSKSENNCLGGNVIFEITPVSGIAERDKRAPRDISMFSCFPEEEEVIMPICSVYRITEVDSSGGVIKIKCDVLDHI
ncbi:ADP-ribosyltransferase domain-containing protein [Labilibaculum euxinus]